VLKSRDKTLFCPEKFSKEEIMKTLYFVFIFILISTFAKGQTTVPGGNVSGIWTAAGSPYNVQGDITIHADSTLNIEPGVEVYFMNWSLLTVNGFLEAIGTESDSIHFAPETIQGTWKGLFFDNAPDNSHLDYCSISGVFYLHVHSHIHCTNNSDPVISHCRITGYADYVYYGNIWVESGSNPSISDCVITEGKTAIYWNSNVSNATISGCTISNCTASGVVNILGNLTMTDCSIINNNSQEYPGGGIRSENGNLSLINCTISDNTASNNRGGGVSCTNGTATFTNCTINGNACYDQVQPLGGGGISLYSASATLAYCSIYDNFSVDGGGGIAISNSDLAVDHCTIDGNESWSSNASGISIINGSAADITNSIISNNSTGGGIYNSGTLTVGYTDFFNNTTGSINGNIPTGFGELTQVNINSDSCDVYGNIFLDPLYEDQPAGNLQITWANFPVPDTTRSPCIDAGNPTFPFDPDGTIADMGAYYFDQITSLDPPQNIIVEIIGTDVHLSWDTVAGANSYKVYASDDPYIGFVEDTSGVFAGESWSAPIGNIKKFYYVIASTETIRSKYSDSQGAYHPDRRSRRYESDK
jgi:parallel beta-helix repeat protein